MIRYYISLGSNLGDRLAYLQAGLDGIREHGMDVIAVSPVYETAPWGNTEQGAFLNAVAIIATEKSAEAVLQELLLIELEQQRERKVHWGPRTLDLDIIEAEGLSCDSLRLTLPHPRYWDRAFVLVPLAELEPDWEYQGVSIGERIRELGTQGIQATGMVLK